MNSPPVPPGGWTPRQLADHLDLSLTTIRKYTRVWPHHRSGTRAVRFMAEDVEKIQRLWFTGVNQDNDGSTIQRLHVERRKRQHAS